MMSNANAAPSPETQIMRRRVWESLKDAPVEGEQAAPELLQRVCMPLVFLAQFGTVSVYWAAEISSVVVRVGAAANNPDSAAQAVRLIAQVRRDTDAQHLIMDLLDAPDALTLLSQQPWVRLTGHFEQPIVVHPGQQAPAGWQIEGSFRQALVWARTQGAAPDPTEPLNEVLQNAEADLIAASYAGAVYWLPGSRTVLFVWSGNETDQDGCRVLYAAAGAYTQYLRIHAVICDVRHRGELDQKNQDRLRHFMDCAVFRGAAHCVLVGELRAMPAQEDPMHLYLETLSLVSRVDFVDNFERALALAASRPRMSGMRAPLLDS